MNHKTALVSAISAVAVLIAGAFALGSNLGVFAGAEPQASATVPEPASMLPLETQVFTVQAAPTSTTPEAPPSPAPSSTVPVTVQIPGVGTVSAVVEGDRIAIAGIEAPGFTWQIVEQGSWLVILFSGGGSSVEFTAQVVNGEVVVDVVETVTTTAQAGDDGHDDHDDDDHDDDDHDDDDHDDDDHDDDDDDDHDDDDD